MYFYIKKMTIIHIMKIIQNFVKYIKKLNSWSKSVLFLSLILLFIILTNKYSEPVGVEAFTQMKKYVQKTGTDVYDKFYCGIYDSLVLDDVKNNYEVDEIIRNTITNKNQTRLLDLGSGTGRHAEIFSNLGIDVYGIDISPHMNVLAKKNCPKGKFKTGDFLVSHMFRNNTFTHITCLYFTMYYIKNKLQLIRNCYNWLQPGGYFVLHLVNKEMFDPIINSADPLTMVSAQKYAKKRITSSKVKFKGFTYKANFNYKKGDKMAYFEENMKDDKSGNIRANKHTLYMETQKHILSLVKSVGFIMKGKIDLVQCMHEYQYLYVLYKPS